MNRVHYDVSGILNSEVKTQIKNSLNEKNGIKMVNVDMGRSTVEVGFNDNVEEQDIRESIEHVGCKIE